MRFTALSGGLCVGSFLVSCDGTTLADTLNDMIASGNSGTYTGGKGVIVRSPFDGLSTSDYQVAPATFWSNDIHVPSQLYLTSGGGEGNIWCPNDGWTGFTNTGFGCPVDANTGESGPWTYAQLAVVIGSSMSNFFTNFDNVQSGSWDHGVFYATDANSVDKRCWYSSKYNGYDCPGGWVDASSGTFSSDTSKIGAGNYAAGNPYQGGGGGGAGCHFDTDQLKIDQTDAYSNNQNLVDDYTCHCNTKLSGNQWEDWIQQWINYAQPKDGFSWDGWFAGGKAPSWAVDIGSCWVTNFKDLIDLQNQFYYYRSSWSNQLIPASNWASGKAEESRKYWGWNEIPLSKSALEDSSNWDATLILLPAGLCDSSGDSDSHSCLSTGAQLTMESDLSTFVSKNVIFPGRHQSSNKPGSNVLFVKQYQIKTDLWNRQFFCESITTVSGTWKIVESDSSCYLESGSSSVSV